MIDIALRKARHEDSRDIWQWRNDPDTRANSRNSDPIAWPDHDAWFSKSLTDPDTIQYVILGDDQACGIVRFNQTSDRMVEVSINIAPWARGKGAGKRALDAACRAIPAEYPSAMEIDAAVKSTNHQSLRLFKSCGFQESEQRGDLTILKRPLINDAEGRT